MKTENVSVDRIRETENITEEENGLYESAVILNIPSSITTEHDFPDFFPPSG